MIAHHRGRPAASIINRDRMWHYVEGIDELGPDLGQCTASGSCPARPRSGSTRRGTRLPVPLFPGLRHARHARAHHADRLRPHLVRPAPRRSSARSSRSPAPSRTPTSPASPSAHVLDRALRGRCPGRCRRSWTTAWTSSSRRTCAASCDGMNEITGEAAASTRTRVRRRDRSPATGRSPTPSPRTSRSPRCAGRRAYLGDKLIRVAAPHRILDPKAGPLIAVRLQHPDPQDARRTADRPVRAGAAATDGTPLPGLYAAGEAAGFGGGGVHGYRSLEGTFLGGCLFSGRAAGPGSRRGDALIRYAPLHGRVFQAVERDHVQGGVGRRLE